MKMPRVVHRTYEVWNSYGDFRLLSLGNCAYTNEGIISGSLPTEYYFHVMTDVPISAAFSVEAVKGNMVQLSGVDLVDGTPVLDIKPYLPYCDSIQGAKVPKWVEVDDLLAVASVNFANGFSTSLADCWTAIEKKSLYGSPTEFKTLIRQVLSWDIRSVSQRNAPQDSPLIQQNGKTVNDSDVSNHQEEKTDEKSMDLSSNDDTIYHLILEGLDVSYNIDRESNVHVHTVTSSTIQ